MSLAEFWQQSPKQQRAVIRKVDRAELEAYATQNNLLIYRGKLVKPEEYPCTCELECPTGCHQQKQQDRGREYKNGQCKCPCHRYYEPF